MSLRHLATDQEVIKISKTGRRWARRVAILFAMIPITGWCTPVWLVALVMLAFGCRGTNALSDLDEARTLTAQVRVQLGKTNDASNRAVMADTDEASTLSAGEADKAARAFEQDTAQLATLLQRLRLASELRLLEELQASWSKYRELDRRVLALAVENTNLKAQRLSFGPLRQEAAAFRASIDSAAANVAGKDRCRADELTAKALAAVSEMQALQAPHIAEADDQTMTGMERDMTSAETRAREALKNLTELVAPSGRPTLSAALAALDRFKAVSDQVVALSRRNTNVRSLALALREKPPLAAACDDRLRALQAALATEHFNVTR